MRYTVRVYATSEQEQRSEPLATVVLSDQREQAGWLPERLAAEARFFLERVETTDPELERLICTVLQQPSVRVFRASARRTGAVRTRGDYTAEALYGTPAYWRAVIGQLHSQERLIYDLHDYGRLLEVMDATLDVGEAPAPAVVDRSYVLRQCSLYLLHQGRQGLWAGKAAYNAAQQQWTVPVHEATLGADVQVGEIVVDAHGEIRRARLPESQPAGSLPQHLAAALQRLADMRQDLAPRLRAWWEQIERGAGLAEAAVRAVLTAKPPGTVEVLPAMSHPSLQAAHAEAGVMGERGTTVSAGQAANAVVIETDAVPGARVAITEDAVVVTFVDWQAPSPPLAVCVPDDERRAPQVADPIEGAGDTWTVRFTRLPPGAYLLAIAPVTA